MAAITINATANKMPGTMPPVNPSLIEVPAIKQYSTMGTLGGIITPMQEAAATVAAEKGAEYFFCSIPGIKIAPTAAQVAAAEPQMAPKNSDTTIATMASPPLNRPIRVEKKRTSRLEMPPSAMILPARIKNGSAR